MEKLSLFSAYGVELEYMIVCRDDLSILPISDQLIYDVAGEFKNEIEFQEVAWSNELVLHVIELKTNGPAKTLQSLPIHFQSEVRKINHLLKKYNARLLPTGAHPWMNPFTQAKLWPHDSNIIYETYHKIFDCRGHGWSNLQSVHLNLPFANDEEFAKLHTAIRLTLPILPSLCASTPIIEGKPTGFLDTRLEYYRLNQQKIPSVTGDIIPELIFSEQEYTTKILEKMYRDIAVYDPEKILQEEWLNSRGAIARFDRYTIEIRIMDSQECPEVELAIISLIVGLLKCMVKEKWQLFHRQIEWDQYSLKEILMQSIKQGMNMSLYNKNYLSLFGLGKESITARGLWQHILNELSEDSSITLINKDLLQSLINKGNLAERILAAMKGECTPHSIRAVYHQLADCLEGGRLFNS